MTGDASDGALWAEYVAGSEQAFGRLYTSLAPCLHAFFMRSFGSAATAADLMQQTFLRMHRARDSFRPEARLKPWLFTIAARVRLDELRRRMRQPQLDEQGLEAAERCPSPAAGDPGVRADTIARVVAALDALPESQRVVVHLHRFEGLSFAEIGAILGTSEVAVRGRAFRAFETMRERLRPLVEEGR